MIAGDLPPSSSVTGVKFFAAACATSRPTAVDPVNIRWSKGSAAKALPTTASPVTTWTSSGAKIPATAVRRAAENCGVSSEGFTIARLPAASAPISGASASCSG